MTEDTKLYTLLALAGALPFVAGALLLVLGVDSLPGLGLLDQLVASYGLAIVCFLAGAHWGTYLTGRSADSINLFVISNAIVLAAWFAYVGAAPRMAIGVQIVAFLTLLLIDSRLHGRGIISAAYYRMRKLVTLLVIVCLLMIMVL